MIRSNWQAAIMWGACNNGTGTERLPTLPAYSHKCRPLYKAAPWCRSSTRQNHPPNPWSSQPFHKLCGASVESTHATHRLWTGCATSSTKAITVARTRSQAATCFLAEKISRAPEQLAHLAQPAFATAHSRSSLINVVGRVSSVEPMLAQPRRKTSSTIWGIP